MKGKAFLLGDYERILITVSTEGLHAYYSTTKYTCIWKKLKTVIKK